MATNNPFSNDPAQEIKVMGDTHDLQSLTGDYPLPTPGGAESPASTTQSTVQSTNQPANPPEAKTETKIEEPGNQNPSNSHTPLILLQYGTAVSADTIQSGTILSISDGEFIDYQGPAIPDFASALQNLSAEFNADEIEDGPGSPLQPANPQNPIPPLLAFNYGQQYWQNNNVAGNAQLGFALDPEDLDPNADLSENADLTSDSDQDEPVNANHSDSSDSDPEDSDDESHSRHGFGFGSTMSDVE